MQEHTGRRAISEEPPMSRLFVICGRQITKEQLMKHFASDGEIEECIVIVDKQTLQGKGVAYVKFTKTSSAARALEKNGTCIQEGTRPIKVMISASYHKKKEDGPPEEVDENKFRRLFAVIPVTEDEAAIKKDFSRFGYVTQVRLVPDKKNPKQNAAYITFSSFLETALAIEGCDPSYNPKFCLPRGSLNKEKESKGGEYCSSYCNASRKRTHSPESGRPGIDVKLEVICSNTLNQDRLWRIFDIAPGMKYCNIVKQGDINITASVVYSGREEAQRAVDKIHGLEYPIGERIIVRYENELHDGITPNPNDPLSHLGPPKPLLSSKTTSVKQAFFICMPEAVSSRLLQDAFSRIGDLINVFLVPGKRHGYAAYASEEAADRAIKQLHGIQLGNCKLKVLECQVHDTKKLRQTDQ